MLNHDIGAMIDLEEKAVAESEDSYIVTGYAAVFNNVDRGKDRIMPGAFAKSLREEGLPLILYQHDMKNVVGACVDAKEDKKGLWTKSELPKEDDFVRGRLVPQLKKRAIKGMSIGYKVSKSSRGKDGVRDLTEIKLYEASFVSLPMNPLASVESVKGFVPFQALPIDAKATTWDSAAAFERVKKHFGDNQDEMAQAFLFADPEAGFDAKLLIADLDDNGRLVANRAALYKAAASVVKGSRLSEDAQEAVKFHLDRYYAQIDHESPFKSISVSEWKILDLGEREARLKGLGLTNDLARGLAATSLGQCEADRKSSEREAHSKDEPGSRQPVEDSLRTLLAALGDLARAR